MAGIEVTVQEAKAMLDAQTPLRLVDCRNPDEHQYCRIEGAELMPLSAIPAVINERIPDKGAKVLVYCHHGMRSGRAVEFLRSLGYADAWSIAGGIEDWSLQIDPKVPRY